MELLVDGCTILPGVLTKVSCERLVQEIEAAMSSQSNGVIEAREGRRVGGRNLMSAWNGWRMITGHPTVADLIDRYVGRSAGLVRILFFDKPPGSSWSLSLHRDKTIAVSEHHEPSAPFDKPTRKAGVPHVEATQQLLSQMLTLRLHLDPMNVENGALFVVPRSHRELDATSTESTTDVHCDAGDLFVMRPLLLHGSRASSPDTSLHRRVVHLEIAPNEELPAPYRWHQFAAIRDG